VQQLLLPQLASAYAMVNLEKLSVAGFQHVHSNAAWSSRLLLPERRSLSGESAASVAFCHSVVADTESLQPLVDSSSSENDDEDEAPMPAVTSSEVYSACLLNSCYLTLFSRYFRKGTLIIRPASRQS